jgi:oligopeptide transport system substrate-binding protein
MKLLAPFLLIVVVLALAVAIDDTPRRADLVLAARSDVFTLDPQRQSYIHDFRMSNALYEGLVRWNLDDFTVEPAAAEKPERSGDGLTYTFRLRPDARWSSGARVTAHDFVYSWMRLLLPETAADYSNLMFCIDGAQEFWAWRAEQLADFAADPWAAAGARRDAARAVIRRLEALLAAADLPPAVALPDRAGRPALATELRSLATAADSADDARLDAVLEQAAATRAAVDRLRETDSRRAEVEWMWSAARQRFERTVGVRAVDDGTLRVNLRRPTAYFLDLACFAVCFPVYRPCVEGWPVGVAEAAARHPRGWTGVEAPDWPDRRWVSLSTETGRLEQRHQWARPGSLVSNGPYVLAEWRYKRDLRLERNPQYHMPEAVRSDSVVVLTIDDANTRVLAFETGRIDWLTEIGAEYETDMLDAALRYRRRHADRVDSLRRDGATLDEALAGLPAPEPGERRDVQAIPAFGTDFYSFNCRPELSSGRPNPFHDARVRRAFVLATDKQLIVEQVTQLNEPVVTSLIPPGSIPGYESPTGLPHDPERARRELREAGWTDRDGDGLIEDADENRFPTVDVLWTTNSSRYKWISLALKAQWERELGVRVDLRGTDTKFYKEDLKQGRFMVARGRWYGDYGDPTTFLELCRSTDGNNDRGFRSERVDAMLDDAARELDPQRRLGILQECERVIVAEEVPMLVLCQLVQVYMYDPARLRGISRHPRLVQYLWTLERRDGPEVP